MHSFAALADPTRRRIIELLSRGERSAGDIVDEFDMSASAISQHLKVLREAKLVQMRVDAQRRIYQLNSEGLSEMDDWLRNIRSFWGSRLDDLEHELRKPQPNQRKRSKR